MSIDLMSAVYRRGPRKPGPFSVLQAIADNANDEGVCWPSTELIARKSRLGHRRVLDLIKLLEVENWLRVERKVVPNTRQGRPASGFLNRYYLNLEKLAYRPSGAVISREKFAHEKRLPNSREKMPSEKPVDKLRKTGGKPVKKPPLGAKISREIGDGPLIGTVNKNLNTNTTADDGDGETDFCKRVLAITSKRA